MSLSAVYNFLQTVLPSQGVYVIWTNDSDKRTSKNLPFDTIDELSRWVIDHANDYANHYIAVGAFKERSGPRSIKRTTENVKCYKSLILDIDAETSSKGKPREYKNKKEALIALYDFCNLTKIPLPNVIDSGYGIHGWWPLDDELTPAEWQSMQAMLGSIAQHYGLKIDKRALILPSQVLRPVGMLNYRGIPTDSRRIKQLSPTLNTFSKTAIHEWLTWLAKQIDYSPEYYDEKAQRFSAPAMGAETINTIPPTTFDIVEANCAQVRWAVHNQAQVGYDMWWPLVGVAKFTAYSEQTAQRWFSQYPGFSMSETLYKLNQWTAGPPLCKTFEMFGKRDDHNVSLCAECKFNNHDLVKSPAQIGAKKQELKIDTDDKIVLPRGYRFTTSGVTRIEDEVEIVIVPYIVWIESIYMDQMSGNENVIIKWLDIRRSKTRSFVVESSLVSTTTSVQEFGKTFANQGITFSNGQSEARELLNFIAEFKREIIEKESDRPEVQVTNGWHGDNILYFTMGEKIFTYNREIDKVEIKTVDSNAAARLTQGISSGGDFGKWKELTSLLNQPDMTSHAAAFVASLGTPLLEQQGVGGVMMHLHNNQSGTGKTSMLRLINSVYGHPDQMMIRGRSTHNAVMRRLSVQHNIPVTVDEVTNMAPGQFSNLVYEISSGAERGRLNADLNERSTGTWNTLVATSANRDIGSLLVNQDRTNISPELLRLIQIEVGRSKFFSDTERAAKFYHELQGNYGHAAREIIPLLILLVQKFRRDTVYKVREHFGRHFPGFKFQGNERYQAAIIEPGFFVANILKQAKIIDVEIMPAMEHLLDVVEVSRRNVNEVQNDSLNLIGQFINDHIDSVLLVEKREGGLVIPHTLPKNRLLMRTELLTTQGANGMRVNEAKCFIDRANITRWLAKKGCSYNSILGELRQMEIAVGKDNASFALAKDTTIIGGPRVRVLTIDLKHPRLAYLLNAFDSNAPALAVVNS